MALALMQGGWLKNAVAVRAFTAEHHVLPPYLYRLEASVLHTKSNFFAAAASSGNATHTTNVGGRV